VKGCFKKKVKKGVEKPVETDQFWLYSMGTVLWNRESPSCFPTRPLGVLYSTHVTLSLRCAVLQQSGEV